MSPREPSLPALAPSQCPCHASTPPWCRLQKTFAKGPNHLPRQDLGNSLPPAPSLPAVDFLALPHAQPDPERGTLAGDTQVLCVSHLFPLLSLCILYQSVIKSSLFNRHSQMWGPPSFVIKKEKRKKNKVTCGDSCLHVKRGL